MNQIYKSLTAIVLLTAASAQAQDLSSALETCKKIKSQADRLICFDAVASMNKTTAPIQPEKPAPVSKDEIVKEIKQQEFGLKSQKEDPETLVSTIKKIKKNPYGKLTIYLEEGQVWKQSDSSKLKLKKGYSVSIRKAALGSFLLSTENSKRTMRVKRVK